jgi:hypothetical protein
MLRAARRPLLTLVVTFAVASLIFIGQVRRPKMYEAEVGLLITEGAFSSDGRPRPRGELRAFIGRAALAAPQLESVIQRHDLGRILGATSSDDAVVRVRNLIWVQVSHDYFEVYREVSDPPRSARVTIGFAAPDPALALAVAQDLGRLVAETQTAREAETAAMRVDELRVLAEAASGRAKARSEELEETRRAMSQQPSAPSRLDVDRLAEIVQAAKNTAKAAAADVVEAQLQAQAVRQIGGLVEVVDPGVPLWQSVPRGRRLLNQAAISLFFAVFLAVFLVGALDPTIRDEQDLSRAGFRPLGRIPVGGAPAVRDGVVQ